ncbi:MAG: DUF4340 domain-containing protein [Gemmatimonadales bacterium]|nr:DUF4340 domain-containing protein [Gemmatimonadales bacterium]
MSPRQLALVAAALAGLLLLWGAAALVRERGAESGGRFALPAIARSTVDTVRIARRHDTTVLARRDSASWTANGYAAAPAAMKELLDALADSTRRSELVAERSASHADLGVDSGGSRVRIAGRSGALAEIVLGQRSPDLDGGYMRMAKDSAVWLVRGGLAGALERGLDEWRDKRIGAVPADSVSRIEVARGRRSYALRRSDGKWSFESGAAGDSVAVAEFLGAFGEVEAAGFASAAQADSTRFTRPDRRVRLLRADGTAILTLAFDSMPAGFWARGDSAGVVYRMENWTVDRLTPADSTLRARR